MHEKIQNLIPEAMRAKDTVRLTTLRGMVAAFTNEVMALKRKPQEKVTDEEAVAVVSRLVKQRKDSIEQFEKGGRNDLADNEKAELKILEEFLPAQMSAEQIEKIARLKIEELKFTDKSKIGILIGAIMKECKGQADGTLVKKIVEEILG
jgi:uncharacterized protein